MTTMILDFSEETLFFILQLFLVIHAILGFSFYIWFLSISEEETQKRLLNILYGYLAAACLGFCPCSIVVSHVNDHLYDFCIRIGAVFISGITLIFLLISVASILIHFRPGLYLELSVGNMALNHKIAAPALLLFFILTEQLLNFSCPQDFAKCEVSNLRRFLMIPNTVISFLCQLTVIVDITLGWHKIYIRVNGVLRPNLVIPINNDMEMVEISAFQETPYNPALLLDHHVVC